MTTSLGLEAFLGHKTRGGGGTFMKSWKRREPPALDVWLHCHSPIVAVWQHNWPKLVEKKDKNDDVTIEVWGGQFNSWETEELLKKQYKRSDGERDVPPIICPMSLMIEQVRLLVEAGELSWVEPLFEFIGDDSDKGRIIHAAGLYNGYNGDLDAVEKKELKKAGIRLTEAWMENAMAKCNYVFAVVDNDSPEDGVQITSETTLLGDKVKEVIRDAKTALGIEDGNPLRNPYCIRFEHHPKQQEFHKKYKAIRMQKVEASQEVLDIIEDPDKAPNIEGIVKRGNVTELRTSMEAHYIGPKGALDFDEIFRQAEAEAEASGDADDDGEDEKPAESNRAQTQRKASAAKSKAGGKARKAKKPEPEPEPDPEPEADGETCECDECGAEMTMDQTVCPGCSFDYGEGAQDPEPAPKQRKKRSTATTTRKRPF